MPEPDPQDVERYRRSFLALYQQKGGDAYPHNPIVNDLIEHMAISFALSRAINRDNLRWIRELSGLAASNTPLVESVFEPEGVTM